MSEGNKKRNRTNFYGVMLLMYTIWKYWNIVLQRLDIVQKSLWISSHFDRENYTRRLDIVFLSDLLRYFVPKYLKQLST